MCGTIGVRPQCLAPNGNLASGGLAHAPSRLGAKGGKTHATQNVWRVARGSICNRLQERVIECLICLDTLQVGRHSFRGVVN
jgi:hypothetical protein